MDQIGEHCGGEIEAKHVNFGIETFPYQSQNPSYEVVFPIDANHAVFHTAFLQNS
jgi:hypothetical protein